MSQQNVPDPRPEGPHGEGSNRRAWQEATKHSQAGSDEKRDAQQRPGDAPMQEGIEGKDSFEERKAGEHEAKHVESDSYSAAAERRFNENVEAMVRSGKADENDVDGYDGSSEDDNPRRDD